MLDSQDVRANAVQHERRYLTTSTNIATTRTSSSFRDHIQTSVSLVLPTRKPFSETIVPLDFRIRSRPSARTCINLDHRLHRTHRMWAQIKVVSLPRESHPCGYAGYPISTRERRTACSNDGVTRSERRVAVVSP
jgi:hypothetical protein